MDANTLAQEHLEWRLAAYGRVIRGDEDTSEDQVAVATYSDADARRLVACWNACEGIETEQIEAGPGYHAALVAHSEHRAYGNELATARALLQDIMQANDTATANLKALGLTLSNPSTSPLWELEQRVRLFLSL